MLMLIKTHLPSRVLLIMMNFTMMTMATQISRAKRIVRMLERVLKKDHLYNEEELKLIREQLKVARNELARIQEQTSKGFG